VTTIGVLGGRWRATVASAGTIEPWDGSAPLNWFIAGDDRWYVPANESTVRQRLIDNAPVVETRVRVPNGDAVQRVWCVAEGNGLTLIEVENDSTLPFAVAFDRGDVLSARPPTDVPIHGIELPKGSVVFPVGHRSSVLVALRHTGSGPGRLPDRLPTAMQVARGWMSVLDRAGRLVVPDEALVAEVARARSELVLSGPSDPRDDAVAFLFDVGELVRLGERADRWVPDLADAVSVVARRQPSWERAAALDAAAIVLAAAGEERALEDIARFHPAQVCALPTTPPPTGRLAWLEQRIARPTARDTADLLSGGIPPAWFGANFEVYSLPVGPTTTASFAVRWHGDRPAVLWEVEGPLRRLTASVAAPEWSTTEPKGEALWPAPLNEPVPVTDGVSFS
jgi:hypothetical protein